MDGVLDDNMLLIRYIYKHCRFRQKTCIIPNDPAAVLRLMTEETCHQGYGRVGRGKLRIK
jgi:hypothetical protein